MEGSSRFRFCIHRWTIGVCLSCGENTLWSAVNPSVRLCPMIPSIAVTMKKQTTVIMKKQIAVFTSLVLALAAQGSIIQFDLSPAGSDAAAGLSPLNEVPARTNSTGSGGELLGGISFNTDSNILTLALGFGSAAGFTDLTAPATAAHIHGPAGPGTNAAVLVHLTPLFFTPTDSARGAIIFGQVAIPTNEVANLLAGLHYINVHNTNFPGGEIRGQLIPILNRPPLVSCPPPYTVECGGAATISVNVSDADANALLIVWTVNGVVMQTNLLAAGTTVAVQAVNFTAEFPLGTNVVSVAVNDGAAETVSCSTTVTVVDTIPPVITSVKATPSVLWPPNHKMVALAATATVVDVCGTTTWKITAITSSEPVNSVGDGNTSPDWEITGAHTANLRAERSGVTGPRIYTITVQAEDAAGNLSQPKTVTVTVPHNKGGK